MLNDASGFRRIYLATGYTDLRRGMEGLASIIKFNFQLDPYQKDILFLFCGRRTDRIKGLVWEGDGFLLLYKRLELGAFNWPRTKEEALEITPEQYQYLMPKTNRRTDILPNMVAVFRIILYYKSVTKYRRTRHTFTKSNGLYAMS